MWLSIAASAQKNDILRLVLNLLVPWDLFFTYILSRYKDRLRDRLPLWLDRIRTLEAANSLASLAALHPGYAFPVVRDTLPGEDVFVASGLGHPLLADTVKVRNDFRTASNGRIALVTGSNMSGKSTFLRTVGVNLVLALAGGPVDARELRTADVRVFASMNVTDSVTDGISYFYAEVRRLKRLLTELEDRGGRPLFYLVDEIFRGTNNREQLIGSRSLLRAFLEGNGMGLVATHDLELVQLEAESEGISNFHFREHVAAGAMVFDYLLRPGPCPTTNALKIMRMEGLPLESPPDDAGAPDVGASNA
jgi:DNA mismatch repair ATPase MutS